MFYESGRSVADRFIGRNPKGKTYIYVDDTFKCDFDYSFSKMVEEVNKTSTILSMDKDKHTISDNKSNTYELAKERVFDVTTGTIKEKPGDILRHIITRNFTVDTLYINENDEYVDLTRTAVRDIRNGGLYAQHKDFVNMYVNNPELITDIFEANEYYGFGYGNSIANVLHRNMPARVIENADELFGNIINNPTLSNRFNKMLQSYSAVSQYFYNILGLKVAYVFNTKDYSVAKHKKAIESIPLQNKRFTRSIEEVNGILRVIETEVFQNEDDQADDQVAAPTPRRTTRVQANNGGAFINARPIILD